MIKFTFSGCHAYFSDGLRKWPELNADVRPQELSTVHGEKLRRADAAI